MTGAWRELPEILQEGVAIWVSICALGREGEFGVTPPSTEAYLDALTISYNDYKRADRARQVRIEYAATWMARRLFE